MEKLELSTPDITQENIEKIASLFPDVVTESLDDDGNVVRAVDFDALRQDLSGAIVDGPRERYQFTWPGKQAAKLEARKPCDKTLRPVRESSVDWSSTENLYIEGDNLEALKIMRETYAGEVKLIYIDPPYNTGHDFIYDDDFAQTRADYEAESGEFDEEGGRLVANPESNGRFHSDWCSMMYPRLLLARDMLRSDGVIAISIDDVEQANLREMCDEIFGRANFEGHIHWRRRHNQPNDVTKMLGLVSEHILVYAKSSIALRQSGVGKVDITGSFSNPDNDPRGDWASKPWKTGSGQSGTRYAITSPTGKVYEEEWMGDQDTYNRLLQDGRIVFPRGGDGLPRKKYFKFERAEEGQCATNWWSHEEFGHNQGASECVARLFDGRKNLFSNPKPTELIRGLIQVANVGEGDIVLDFFAGSSTTAHSVMLMNAEDNQHRRFILVQLDEDLDESLRTTTGKRKEQIKNAIEFLEEHSMRHTLCEIGEERLRRAGNEIATQTEAQGQQLQLEAPPKQAPDVGFRVLRIDASNFRDTYREPADIKQSTIFDYVDNLIEGRTAEDLLFQVFPQFRIPYSAKYTMTTIAGKTVFNVNEGQLIACFDVDVDENIIEEIAKMRPLYAVFRDASMADDATAANFEEYFKTYSPDTIRRVI